MARVEVDPNYTGPTFSRATAGTDLFKKEDVQQLAAAVSTHVHDGVHGLGVAPAAATIPGSALTNGSVTLAKLAADSVDSSKIVDGTIATTDLANAAVTNAKLASDTARANLLTNGGFEIWQRGNGPFTTSVYTADRWMTLLGAGSTVSVTHVTNSPNGTGSSLQAVYTHAAATGIYQDIKLSENSSLRGKVVSFSAWVFSTVGSAASIQGFTDGTGAPTMSSAVPGSSTWTKLTCTLSGPVPNDATYLRVQMLLGGSCTALITQAMLVVGSVAADYAPLHPADDLARCLRYYEVHANLSAGTPVGVGQAWSTTQASVPFQYRAIKPAVPTITLSANTDFQLESAVFGALALNGFSAVAPVYTGVDLRPTVASGLVAGNATLMAAANANAKLILEANP